MVFLTAEDAESAEKGERFLAKAVPAFLRSWCGDGLGSEFLNAKGAKGFIPSAFITSTQSGGETDEPERGRNWSEAGKEESEVSTTVAEVDAVETEVGSDKPGVGTNGHGASADDAKVGTDDPRVCTNEVGVRADNPSAWTDPPKAGADATGVGVNEVEVGTNQPEVRAIASDMQQNAPSSPSAVKRPIFLNRGGHRERRERRSILGVSRPAFAISAFKGFGIGILNPKAAKNAQVGGDKYILCVLSALCGK